MPSESPLRRSFFRRPPVIPCGRRFILVPPSPSLSSPPLSSPELVLLAPSPARELPASRPALRCRGGHKAQSAAPTRRPSLLVRVVGHLPHGQAAPPHWRLEFARVWARARVRLAERPRPQGIGGHALAHPMSGPEEVHLAHPVPLLGGRPLHLGPPAAWPWATAWPPRARRGALGGGRRPPGGACQHAESLLFRHNALPLRRRFMRPRRRGRRGRRGGRKDPPDVTRGARWRRIITTFVLFNACPLSRCG